MHTTFNIVPMSREEKHNLIQYILRFSCYYDNMFQGAEQMGMRMERFTCSYEHDVILSIFCFYFVHHDLRKLVIHVCFDYDWSIVDGVDGIKHGWVAPSKGHDLIWELFSGVMPSEHFAWALWMEQVRFQSKGRISVEPWAACLRCQAEGREPVPGKGPTGSLVHLDERKDPERPS